MGLPPHRFTPDGEQCGSRWISGEQCPVACHLPTSPEKNIVSLPSPRPPQCWEHRTAAWNHQIRTSCLNRELGSSKQSGWRGLVRWRIPVGPPPAPGVEASVLLIEPRGLQAVEVCHKPPHQIVMESGAVDNFDKEAVSNAFEISTAMAIVLLGGLRWLKPETTLAEMGSRAEAVECLGLKPFWEERVTSASTMNGRRRCSNIFIAWQSSDMGW